MTASEQRRLESDLPGNPTGYEFFLRGNEAVGPHAISSSSNLRVARELYTRSVEEDPRFAPAWARLGRCHHLIGKFETDPDRRDFARADACFTKALELNIKPARTGSAVAYCTVTLADPLTPPSVAVMVTVPGATPVVSPAVTVATAPSVVVHAASAVTFCVEPSSKAAVAVS